MVVSKSKKGWKKGVSRNNGDQISLQNKKRKNCHYKISGDEVCGRLILWMLEKQNNYFYRSDIIDLIKPKKIGTWSDVIKHKFIKEGLIKLNSNRGGKNKIIIEKERLKLFIFSEFIKFIEKKIIPEIYKAIETELKEILLNNKITGKVILKRKISKKNLNLLIKFYLKADIKNIMEFKKKYYSILSEIKSISSEIGEIKSKDEQELNQDKLDKYDNVVCDGGILLEEFSKKIKKLSEDPTKFIETFGDFSKSTISSWSKQLENQDYLSGGRSFQDYFNRYKTFSYEDRSLHGIFRKMLKIMAVDYSDPDEHFKIIKKIEDSRGPLLKLLEEPIEEDDPQKRIIFHEIAFWYVELVLKETTDSKHLQTLEYLDGQDKTNI